MSVHFAPSRFLFEGPPAAGPQRIDLLLLPEFSNLTLAAAVEPLRAANRAAGQTLYAWRLLSPDGKPAVSSSGLPVAPACALPAAADTPVLFVVASYNAERHCTRALVATLRRLHARGCQFAGLESGSYVLAKAGLLDGYRATTHWEDLDDLATRYPAVTVVPDRFVVDRDRFTSGGATPCLDLVLNLIRAQHGYGLALDVASAFIYDQERLPSDPQRIVSVGRLSWQEPRLARAIRLMEDHLEQPLGVARIAARLGLGVRTLERLFAGHLGITPGRYYRLLRLNAARRLLAHSDRSITEVAVRCGFASGSSLARALRSAFGRPPGALRRGSARHPETQPRRIQGI